MQITDTNQQFAEVFAEAIIAKPIPKETLIQVIHGIIDHPWVDDELRDHLVLSIANTLQIEVLGNEEVD
jgi:hypothetical protein